jgi:hypothetical protein
MTKKKLLGAATLAFLLSAGVAGAQTSTTTSTTTPGTPNTGAGGGAALALGLGVLSIAAVGGGAYLARRSLVA